MREATRSGHPKYHIESDGYRAEIAGRGGGIKALSFRGQDLLETYSDGRDAPHACGVVLAPWPNRTADGQFFWAGQWHQLAVTEPERNNAIHGLVHGQVWECARHDSAAVELTTLVSPQPGWPWPVDLRANYRLNSAGLTAEYFATAEEAPFALGLHTYLAAGEYEIDACTFSLEVDHNLPLDDRKLPGSNLPELSAADAVLPGIASGVRLHDPQALGTCRDSDGRVWLDHCFRGASPSARLTWPDGHGVRLSPGANMDWVQVYTAPDFPGRHGTRRALAVEPMSAPPNALASGRDIVTLRPEAPATFALRISAF